MNRSIRSSWLLLAVLFCLAMPAAAQDVPVQIDTYLAGLAKQQKISGVVLVAENGQVIYERAFGMADYGRRRPNTKDTLFNLASLSKQFTAMAVMLLKEKGSLAYDDDIRKYLPGLPYQGVTIRHLLHHTGGLPDYMELPDDYWDQNQIFTNKDIVALLKQYKPAAEFKPGSKYEYSNTGYALLALIVEKASRMSYAQFLKSRIFKPLGMNSSVVYSPANMKPYAARRAFGFKATDNGYELNDVTFLDGVVGDGGIYSTAADLLRWDQALYGETLVSADTLREALTPGTLNDGKATEYGFGWVVQGPMAWHDGSWVGFRTMITRYLESRKTVIILTNNNCEVMEDIDKKLEKLLGE